MTPEVDETIKKQMQRFKEKFGRDPGPDDPLYFDPDKETPEAMTDEKVKKILVESMMSVGIDLAIIYAYQKTGFIASLENWDSFSIQKQMAWCDALDEWEKLGKQ
jgi:hypothetical protein